MKNPKIDRRGTKRWYNSVGQTHRDDGPANEWTNGGKSWYINGLRHREDGPAAEYANGIRVWYINGLRHRDNGPAYMGVDGTKNWYIKGKNITKEVDQWIIDNNFPEYEDWNDTIKVMFKLKFG